MTGWSTDHMFYVDDRGQVWSPEAAIIRGHYEPEFSQGKGTTILPTNAVVEIHVGGIPTSPRAARADG